MTGETEADGGEPAGTTGDVESGQQGTFARVFTERDTQRRLGLILATYVLAGLGIGVAGYFTIDAFTGGSTGFGAEFISAIILIITVVFVGLIGVPIAVLLGPGSPRSWTARTSRRTPRWGSGRSSDTSRCSSSRSSCSGPS